MNNTFSLSYFFRSNLPVKSATPGPSAQGVPGELPANQKREGRASAGQLWSLALLVVAACAMTGCAHQYVIKLNNGLQLTCAGKPHLRGAYYYYKDAEGRERSEPAVRVLEIEPASMAKEERGRFKPSPQ